MNDQDFRNAVGTFPTGVTIITTKHGDIVHGMTANAFMSVSLNPKLLVISIDEKASMLNKIKQSNRFALSILAENQHDISMHFAGQKKRDKEIQFDWLDGLPIISGSLANIVCTVKDAYIAGDHTLFIGELNQIHVADSGFPLTFYKGKYQSIKELKN